MTSLLLIRALGADGPPPLDRVPPADVVALVATMLLLLATLRWRTRILLYLTGYVGGTVACGVLLCGPLVFPLLFFTWRRHPGKGFGWMLLATMVCGTALLAWRIPWPRPLTTAALQHGRAVIVAARTKTDLWSSWHTPGTSVRTPFQIVTLDLTPAGSGAPVQALDTVDAGSSAGLVRGATVSVEYPPGNPAAARLSGATRDYARDALVYFLELTYGLAMAVICVGLVLGRVRRAILGSRAATTFTARQSVFRDIAALPDDESRRKALEALLGRSFPDPRDHR